MEQALVNNSVRVSQVSGIDEEILEFKAIVAVNSNAQSYGDYSFTLPPLTDLTNSTGFNQARIKLDLITISPTSEIIANVAVNNDRPVWTDKPTLAASNTELALASIIFTMNLPSRQTTWAQTNLNNAIQPHGTENYKFNELIPTFWTFRGNYQGLLPPNNIAGQVAGNQFAIQHKPNNNGVMCANPFGQDIRFGFRLPFDTQARQPIYLAEQTNANAPRDDITEISFQLSITLIPNK